MSAVGGRAFAMLGIAIITCVACAPGGGIVGAPSVGPAPLLSDVVIQSNLIVPWDVAVSGDGRMFVTERPGTIDVFASVAPQSKRIASAQVAGVRAMGDAGLLGLALDPEFAANGLLYVCASRTDQGEWRNQILRYRVSSAAIALDGVVFKGVIGAAGIHSACRLRFGPDGKLWIATGDAGQSAHAQDPASLNGKILRINSDGSVPTDNPTLNGATTPGAVYALGLRNPGGIAFHPETGTCFVIDAGDQMQDEIDIVTPGANFGWPTITGAAGGARGFAEPAWTSGKLGYAVAGAAFVDDAGWGAWRGSLFVATLKEQDVRRFTIEDGHAIPHEVLLDQRYGRLRAVTMAPDGALLVTTSNGSGDRIIRIAPAR
jgi:glucose/arabinose dehydrogenase